MLPENCIIVTCHTFFNVCIFLPNTRILSVVMKVKMWQLVYKNDMQYANDIKIVFLLDCTMFKFNLTTHSICNFRSLSTPILLKGTISQANTNHFALMHMAMSLSVYLYMYKYIYSSAEQFCDLAFFSSSFGRHFSKLSFSLNTHVKYLLSTFL
jgi:hypothetical protein